MPYDFPQTPAVNDEYAGYVFDGLVWNIKPGDPAAPPDLSAYVLKAGDTMSGPLVLPSPDPSDPLHSGHKRYIDTTVATMALYQSTWQVAANVPDLNVPPNAPLNGYTWTAVTADRNVPETAPAGIPGIGGLSIGQGDTVKWSTANAAYDLIKLAGGAMTDYVLKTGDTMTGDLLMDAPGKIIAKGTPPNTTGMVALSGGAVGRTGMVEFYNDTALRLARLGWGTASRIEFKFENGCGGLTMLDGGMSFGTQVGVDPTDVSKHLMLYAGTTPQNSFGINVTGGRINYSVGEATRKHVFMVGTNERLSIGNDHLMLGPRDGYGIQWATGNAIIYKVSGGGMRMRKSSGGQQWMIENNDGTGPVNIATTALALTVEEQIAEKVTPLLERITKLEADLAELRR